ncbi:hypothetical protein [Streptomyces mesophilus]|uniref:hypothetical protein n=1 Tax=Streptomyces mesophilus TaxID=1775132 RepID=UPI00332CADE3
MPTPKRRTAIATLLRRLSVVVMSLTMAGLPSLTAPAAAAAEDFTVYTNERGTDQPALEQFGAVKSTVVYDFFHFTCDYSRCYSNGGALPSQATYEAKIKEYLVQFGADASAPLVLDFEDIVLTALSGQAATNAFNLWKNLITWTHNAAPSAPVGMYGYDWSTTNNSLTKQLHQNGLFDFFAPRGYRSGSETDAQWASRMDAAIANDRALAPGQPIYPYISPHYDGSPNGTYHSATTWAHTLNYLKTRTEGAVVWEPSANSAAACNWVQQHSYEMGVITGTGSSGPLHATATAPSGNCTVTRGTTNTVQVVLTNTSALTTAATQMQSFTGAPGFTGSWKYWNVPALAPGDSFTTELPLAIAASQSNSTALLRIRTGISTTRWSVVVP